MCENICIVIEGKGEDNEQLSKIRSSEIKLLIILPCTPWVYMGVRVSCYVKIADVSWCDLSV